MPATRRTQRQKAGAAATTTTPTVAAAAAVTPGKATRKKKSPPTPSTANSSSSNISKPNKKKKLTGLQDAMDTSAPLGVIDPESKIQGSIENLDGEPCDVMLALVDPSKNSDKFFVLQLIRKKKTAATKNKRAGVNFAVYSRWGRTGTVGQALVQQFDALEAAVACFVSKFRQKTGLKWEDRTGQTKPNKYCFVVQNFMQKQGGFSGAFWQYWVDDGIDGKTIGWYYYTDDGSCQAERLYQEYMSNTQISQRYVASGAFTYNVNLIQMEQTNVTHPNRALRHIRRHPVGIKMNNDAPVATKKCPMKTASGGSHPVDPDISIQDQSVNDFSVVEGEDRAWYDIVLNQCNIAGNNNKYYRMQMLQEKTGGRQFFVWLKWGRVGESAKKSASTWLGPFDSIEDAHKPFAKKYKDKSGNVLDADPFVPKKNKYVPVEIDNDAEVDEKALPSSSTKQCAPSVLHPKTRELIEVLFSKDMRNEALSNFHIDLKKLPLGVPSKQQIEQGIDILVKIEEKLNGEDVEESFMDLSSRFYTTIPHSFGRSRPPVIGTSNSLQQRYDMCNILLDIYSTSETVRKTAVSEINEDTEQASHPADLHYKSLNTDVTPLDKKTKDYKMIQKYFTLTKSSNSDLLGVFSVNRHSESARFQKFNKTDNRRLLWHGTNIAVVAPILTSGLRIMPHSGGRVGAGIYLAGMQEKSAQYTSGYGAKFACMFLCEAPLGRQHPIMSDGSHASCLKEAPRGFDSVHAMGTVSPPTWRSLDIGGKDVQIPQSKAVQTNVQSSFHHDEFLVYDESQVRIRYVLTVKL